MNLNQKPIESSDRFYMEKCFELALKAKGMTSPNPLVGSVIVKENKIIAEGFHAQYGQPHAEKMAFSHLKQSAQGATLYCNLEPCSHTNKSTPPCVPELIKQGIKRVVISNIDPNPYVNSKGVLQLQEAGIEVIAGVLSEKGEELNEVFFHNMRKKECFIHMKIASTLDGNIAMKNGESKWITGPQMRMKVHEQRFLYDAIAIGSKTYELDSPSLTIRHPDLADKTLKKIVFSNKDHLEVRNNFTVLSPTKIEKSGLSLPKYLYQKLSINSLYLEAGQAIATSFLNHRWVNKISYCIAPKILGNQKHSFSDLDASVLNQGFEVKNPKWEVFGHDIMCTGRMSYPVNS